MARAKLDRIDRRILSDLQANGRMTNVELAERAGISAPPCLRRVRALERAGIIKGYHADLSPEQLGYSVSVFALVGLNSQAEADLKSFEELVSSWNEIRECHMLAGEADFLLKIVAETWDEYQKFLTTRLTSAPNVSHVKSMMVFRNAQAAAFGRADLYGLDAFTCASGRQHSRSRGEPAHEQNGQDCMTDVTLERLHEIADAFARRDVDGIVNSFAEDGEFRNAKGLRLLGS